MIEQFIRFCVVGVSGTIIDFGTTFLLKEKAHINKYIANSTGFTLAATSNYILNRVWSFENHNPAIGKQYLLFMVISVMGLLINNLMIFLLTKKWNANFYLSKVAATGLVMIWNFLMNFFFTFR
jgi:putative flippase GtrA